VSGETESKGKRGVREREERGGRGTERKKG